MSLLRQNSTFFAILLIFIFCLPVLLPLFQRGFFLTDDGEWMIIRFSAFHEAFRNGQFPVRFLPRLNFQYGYPVANFLYPGFMYLGEVFHLVGFGFVDTIKMLFGLSVVGGSLFTYFWLRRFFSTIPSVVGSFVYTYMPYHLYDLYHRGSVGEMLALAAAPFILWQLHRKSFFFSSIGIGFLILSHNTIAFLFLPLLIIYTMLLFSKKNHLKQIYKYTSIFVVGFGLSAFFWIPALYDLRYTVFSQTQVSQWQRYFASIQLIGLPTLILALMSLVFVFLKKRNQYPFRLFIFFFVIATLSLFFSIQVSSIFWELIPISFIQFPFRFLSITIVTMAFLASFILSVLKQKQQVVGGLIIATTFFLAAFAFLRPQLFFDKGDGFYATNQDTTTVRNEYMPKWVKDSPREMPTSKVTIQEEHVENLVVSPNGISFATHEMSESLVTINTVYFPGWKVVANDRELPISYENERGLIAFTVPEGKQTVRVFFTETPIRMFSDFLSLLSFTALLGFVVIKQRREHEAI